MLCLGTGAVWGEVYSRAHRCQGISWAVSWHFSAHSADQEELYAVAERPFTPCLDSLAVLCRKRCHIYFRLFCSFDGLLGHGKGFLILSYIPKETDTGEQSI